MKRDPEREARWAEARRRMEERIEHNERLIRAQRERQERRRQRVQRLTFGLFPR